MIFIPQVVFDISHKWYEIMKFLKKKMKFWKNSEIVEKMLKVMLNNEIF